MVEAMNQGNTEVKKLLREYFKDAGWQSTRVLEGMETAKDFYVTSWDQVRMPKWATGRVVLVRITFLSAPAFFFHSLAWAPMVSFVVFKPRPRVGYESG